MEFRGVFHVRHPLAHQGAAQNNHGARGEGALPQGGVELAEGVAVALKHIPSVGLPEGGDVHRHDRVQFAGDLDVVPVHQGSDVAQLLLCRHSSCLGGLSLGLASVSHEDVGSFAILPGLLGKSKAHAGREPLAEISASPVYTRNVPLHVALIGRTALAEVGNGLQGREKAPLCKGSIGSGGGMAVTDGYIVPIQVRAVVRGKIGHSVDRQVHLHAGKGACRVAAVRQGHHGHGIYPCSGSSGLQGL